MDVRGVPAASCRSTVGTATHAPMHAPLRQADLVPEDRPLRRLGSSLLLLRTVDSTNRLLLAEAANLDDGAVAVAERQTAGRGRRGRRWEAPRGAAVLVSVLLVESPAGILPRVASLLAAVAACEAVEATTDCTPGLRWPNDLVIEGRKLGGVLVETRRMSGADGCAERLAIVIGIGLNCLQQPGHFPGSLRGRATSLEIEGSAAVDRRRVARCLLARLDERIVATADSDGVGELRDAWRRRCIDIGRPIRVRNAHGTFEGVVSDVTTAGDLIVETTHAGRKCFASATTTRVEQA